MVDLLDLRLSLIALLADFVQSFKVTLKGDFPLGALRSELLVLGFLRGDLPLKFGDLFFENGFFINHLVVNRRHILPLRMYPERLHLLLEPGVLGQDIDDLVAQPVVVD